MRSYLSRLLTTSSPPVDAETLPEEMWILILGNMEPCFLVDICRVSTKFNALVHSYNVTKSKLPEYFHEIDWDAVLADEKTKDVKFRLTPFVLFSQKYTERFSTLKSFLSRRLLSYIIEADFYSISKLEVSGTKLYDMLCETDKNGDDMLTYLNRSNNLQLKVLILQKYMQKYLEKTYSWNPLTQFDNFIGWMISKFIGIAPLHAQGISNAIELATALGLVPPNGNPEDLYRPLPSFNITDCLNLAVKHGHVMHVKAILAHIKHLKFTCYAHSEESNPLKVATVFHRLEIAPLLLDICPSTINAECFIRGIYFAVEHGDAEITDIYYQFCRQSQITELNLTEGQLAYLTNSAIYRGHIGVVKVLLSSETPVTNGHIELARDSNQPAMLEFLINYREQQENPNRRLWM